MSDSIRGLAAIIDGLKGQAGQLRTAVASTKDATDQIKDQLAATGIEGGPVARLSASSAGQERAGSQLEAIEARLERARFIAMSAINGLRGSGTVARSGDQADDPTSWDKPTSGEELARNDDTKQSRYNQVMGFLTRKGDDVGDSVLKPAAEHVYTAKAVSDADREPPEFQNTTTSTQVAEPPQVVAASPARPNDGSAFIAAVAVTVVAVKGAETAAQTVNRLWRTWKT